eukprot:g3770.t1
MRCNGDPEALSRRRAVASLLIFAKELEKAGRISKASKGLLKELIVHENLEVMSVGEALARAQGGQQQGLPLQILDEQIKKRASKSHQELFEICPLEQAHLLSQQDTAALAEEDSDTKSLVYGEIDFWSFYDVIKVAADGLHTSPTLQTGLHQDGVIRYPPPAIWEEEEEEEEEEEDEDNEKEDEEEQDLLAREEVQPDPRGAGGVGDDRHESRSLGGSGSGSGGGSGGSDRRSMRRRLGNGSAGSEVMMTPEGVRTDGRGGGGGRGRGRGRGEGGGGGGLKFVDLGSGSGKAVFAAVLAVDFRCALGIEVLAGVHHASTRVLKRYRRLVEPVLCSPPAIKLQHGSFLDPACDWSDADLVFANSTCFAEDTLLAIAERAELLRPGARVVTFTTALKTPWLRVLVKRRYQMSWGPATVFVHQKLSPTEHARRLAETTPFDEDQGIPRTAGGRNGGRNTELVEESSPATPIIFAPAWSLAPTEHARRLAETTPFDEDQGIPRTAGGRNGGRNTELVEESSPATPIIFAPAWSLACDGSEGGNGCDVDGDDTEEEEEEDEEEEEEEEEDDDGSGFGVNDGDDDPDERFLEATAGDGAGQGRRGDAGQGTAARRACCSSSPKRPLHC